jgi:hypothetical protein
MQIEHLISNRSQLRIAKYPVSASMEATVIDPLINPQWDRWVQSHKEASIFHTSRWAKVLAKTYGHTPFYLRFCEYGETAALVPLMEVRSFLTGRRGVSIPFSDSCAPLLHHGDAADKVLEELSALARRRKWKYLEMRGPLGWQASRPPSVEFLGHALGLNGGPEALFAGIASSGRRAIRKAERSGVTTQIGTSHDAMVSFYELHVQTRKRHGVPPQPWSFFLNIREEILRNGAGFIVLGFKDSRPVAGAVFFHFAQKAVYKFGASIDDHPEIRANNLVMWEAIKYLSETGFQELDFGRTSCANEGLRRFKLGWGAQERRLSYFKLEPTAGQWMGGADSATGFHNTFFRQLPLAVNRIAGTLIYPHLD